jgi:YHS domain-containing protein
MVNDQFMGRDQIPVEFEGRTYYGCCAGCVTRIQNDPAIRAAIDPVTGRAVDKASAVMGQDSEGNVLYFESEQSFSQYGTQT